MTRPPAIENEWVDSRTAAKLLGIQQRTLYAYVSRGAVRSMAAGKGRPRLYAKGDLDRLRVRRDARAGHGAVAAGALRWGEPVLDSAITAITPRGPAYRGRLAVDLGASSVKYERVAELLWGGQLPPTFVSWQRRSLPAAMLAKFGYRSHPHETMALALVLAGFDDSHRDDVRPDQVVEKGRWLIPMLAACLAPDAATMTRAHQAPTIAAIAARAMGRDDDAAVAAVDLALVLLADHELNASSFAARVAASTGADPYHCMMAALATLSGPKHGRAAEDVASLADHVDPPFTKATVKAALRAMTKRGELPAAFGHPLYPEGDPRAAPLLEVAEELVAGTPRRARALIAIARAAELPPSVDVSLAVLVAALGAPPSAASGLFAVARCAGWLAHALEQRASGQILRPRAKYVGPPVA